MPDERNDLVATGRRVLAAEAEALAGLSQRVDSSFARACELMLACKGRVIVTGMGKSGHVAQKIAASLTSTGTAAHFLHPAEGFHGDLGVVHRDDLLLALSHSGETGEIVNLLPPVKHLGVPLVAVTAHAGSTLAKQADVVLLLGEAKEADVHNLVPTTSTTLSLALGDALTIALMEAKKFTPEDFAVFHPSGMLGKRLTLEVGDLLHGEESNPVIEMDAPFSAALEVTTRFELGGTSVIDSSGKRAGIITDGDARRIWARFGQQGGSVAEALATPVSKLMTADPSYIRNETLASEALKTMENHKPRPIFLLPVVDELIRPVGMLHLHTLVQAGFKTGQRED